MLGATHVLFATCGVIVTAAVHQASVPGASVFLAATVGALLPDIDHPRSLLGSFFPWFGHLPGVRHRGITHTIWAVIGLTVAVAATLGATVVGSALIWGVLSHLFLDSITLDGLPLLTPIRKQAFRIPLLKTGGSGEAALALSLAFAIAWSGIGLIGGECTLPAALCSYRGVDPITGVQRLLQLLVAAQLPAISSGVIQ